MKLIFIIFLFCLPVRAQLTYEFEDACGRGVSDSDFSIILDGKVKSIVDAEQISVEVEGRKRTVTLVAISANSNETAAKDFLTSKILNKRVELLVGSSHYEKKEFDAVVLHAGKDINRLLLQNGIARYKQPKLFTLVRHTDCIYREVEKKSRENRLGIWR